MSSTTHLGHIASARRARRLTVASAVALVVCAALLFLNYRYVSLTVNLDDEVNPYLGWASWSRVAFVIGGMLGILAMTLASAAVIRRDAGLRNRLTAAMTLFGTLGVLYIRYKIRP